MDSLRNLNRHGVPVHTRRPRVVLADDHPSVLTGLRRLLKPSCDVMASVTGGHAAIDAVATLQPEILIVDLMMPDLDGLEVCRRIKQLLPSTAIVIVTACDDEDVRSKAFRDGASAFVLKRSVADTLEATIRRIVADE